MYKAPSGALVFSAGSVQWTWGLDEVHDSPYAAEPADARMQQAQVNLLADMGAQPTTLQADLVAATASTDAAGPTATITSPAAGSPAGQRLAGHRHRHGLRHRRRPRRGRGGLHRRRHVVAPGDRHHVVDLHLRPARPGHRPGQGPRHRRQRQHRRGHLARPRRPLLLLGLRRHRAAGRGLRRRLRGRARAALHADRRRVRLRRPLLQGRRQRRHPRRLALEHQRPAAGDGDVHQRDRHRLAVRELLAGGRADGRHDLRRVLHGPAGPLRRAERGVHRRGRPGAAADGGRRLGSDAGRRLRQPGSVPRQQPQEHQLLRGRRCSRPSTSRRWASPTGRRCRAPRACRTRPTSRAASPRPSWPGRSRSRVTTAGQAVAGATSYDAGTRTITFDPTAALAADTVYDVEVDGTDNLGNPVIGRRHLVVPHRQGADHAGRLPVLALRGHHDADGAEGRRQRRGHPRRALRADGRRQDHGGPLLQGPRQHRHPHRHAVVGQRHVARDRAPSPASRRWAGRR